MVKAISRKKEASMELPVELNIQFEAAQARYEDRSRSYSNPAAAEYHRLRGYCEGWTARDAEVEELREELREARSEQFRPGG